MKLALITGASSGIGRELAISLSKRKIPLLLTGRNKGALEETANRLEGAAEILVIDLAKDRKPLLDWIGEKGPDLVINNAGLGLYGEITSHSIEEEMEILEVNCSALLEISLKAAHVLRQKKEKGVILNISSIVSEMVIPNFSVYVASKAFVSSLSKSLHEELKPFGIEVLASLPGQIATSFQNRASKGNFKQKRSFFVMTPEHATQCILKQLDQRKPISVIDWRNRLLLLLTKTVPKPLLNFLLKNDISDRAR